MIIINLVNDLTKKPNVTAEKHDPVTTESVYPLPLN